MSARDRHEDQRQKDKEITSSGLLRAQEPKEEDIRQHTCQRVTVHAIGENQQDRRDAQPEI